LTNFRLLFISYHRLGDIFRKRMNGGTSLPISVYNGALFTMLDSLQYGHRPDIVFSTIEVPLHAIAESHSKLHHLSITTKDFLQYSFGLNRHHSAIKEFARKMLELAWPASPTDLFAFVSFRSTGNTHFSGYWDIYDPVKEFTRQGAIIETSHQPQAKD